MTMKLAASCLCALTFVTLPALAEVHELRPSVAGEREPFEALANALKPGDELIVHPGVYSQTGRRAITVKGSSEKPIVIRAATLEPPLFTRPASQRDRFNNLELIDCAHLVLRGIRFQGSSSGIRLIRGHHVTIEGCEIFETGNNALTMNSGDCHAMVIRSNHIHHTGLSTARPTEGEGMYIGCHDGSCRTTDSVFEGNYIHHTRGTSDGGNDGIEIKAGSWGNVVRHNVIHDTIGGRQYPGIFVYGGGPGTNIVEGNVIWRAGEGIQVVSDSIIRNNIIFDCLATGITAAPHAAVPGVRNTVIVHNTIFNTPVGVRFGWGRATNVVFANNVVSCPSGVAFLGKWDVAAKISRNLVQAKTGGVDFDGDKFLTGMLPATLFVAAEHQDFWPASTSSVRGAGDPVWAATSDFNGTLRTVPIDIGAYEVERHPSNPGWTIVPGFKPLP